jgi:uncharacterized protein YjiS (DUF1127 family)
MIFTIALMGTARLALRGGRRIVATVRRLRHAARQRAEFARLGSRELRDLGFDRSEFRSCELEAQGHIEVTRLRLWSPPPGDRGPNPYYY